MRGKRWDSSDRTDMKAELRHTPRDWQVTLQPRVFGLIRQVFSWHFLFFCWDRDPKNVMYRTH